MKTLFVLLLFLAPMAWGQEYWRGDDGRIIPDDSAHFFPEATVDWNRGRCPECGKMCGGHAAPLGGSWILVSPSAVGQDSLLKSVPREVYIRYGAPEAVEFLIDSWQEYEDSCHTVFDTTSFISRPLSSWGYVETLESDVDTLFTRLVWRMEGDLPGFMDFLEHRYAETRANH